MTTLIHHNNNKTKIKICFDYYGNLYIEMPDKKLYQVNIDRYNEPVLDHGVYDVINVENNPSDDKNLLGNFDLVNNKINLRNSIKKAQDDNNDIDDTEHEKDINHYPEEDEYYANDINTDSDDIKCIDEDNEKQFGVLNKQFIFSNCNSYHIDIDMRTNGDICALYDTYIYDSNNNLCFKSNSDSNTSYYRLKIFDDGKIFFRPIGYTEKSYILTMNEKNEPSFTKIG